MRSSDRANGALPIIQYWHSEDVPEDVAATIASFRDQNPDLRHMLFDEARAEAFIEERFSARELAAFRACAVPAMQADYLRYCAVLALGGFYADVDLICIRPLRTLIEPGAGGMLVKPVGDRVLGNNDFFLFTVRDHPMLRLALDLATARIEERIADNVSLLTGPWVIRSMWLAHRRGSFEAVQENLPGPRIERLVEALVRVVGDYARITEAFEDIHIAPALHVANWISGSPRRLRYKRSATHWPIWRREGREIFR